MNERRSDERHPGTVLVLGGAGKTGRRVVERLEARGVWRSAADDLAGADHRSAAAR